MRRVILVGLTALCGCASGPSPEETARRDAISREIGACISTFPYGVKRSRCLNAIDERYVKPGFPFPDLLALLDTSRVAIAERYERKEITEAEAQALYARVRSEAEGEFAKRRGQQESLDMQRAALIMSSRPVTCTSFGATTNCF